LGGYYDTPPDYVVLYRTPHCEGRECGGLVAQAGDTIGTACTLAANSQTDNDKVIRNQNYEEMQFLKF